MRRRKMLIAAVAAMLIAVPAGWYFGSPWWTLWRMRDAARAGDAERIASYVDFEALRTQTRGEVRSTVGSLLGRLHPSRQESALADLAARTLSRRVVEPSVGPDVLRLWLKTLRFGGGSGQEGYRPLIEHRGIDTFIMRNARDPEHGAVLTFGRHGLGWKVEKVRWGFPNRREPAPA